MLPIDAVENIARGEGSWLDFAELGLTVLPVPPVAKAVGRTARATAGGARAVARGTRSVARGAQSRVQGAVAEARLNPQRGSVPLSRSVADELTPDQVAALRAAAGETPPKAPKAPKRRGRPKQKPVNPPNPDSTYASPASANTAWSRYVTRVTDWNQAHPNDKVILADRDVVNGRQRRTTVDPQNSEGTNRVDAQMVKAEGMLSEAEKQTIAKGESRKGGVRRANDRAATRGPDPDDLDVDLDALTPRQREIFLKWEERARKAENREFPPLPAPIQTKVGNMRVDMVGDSTSLAKSTTVKALSKNAPQSRVIPRRRPTVVKRDPDSSTIEIKGPKEAIDVALRVRPYPGVRKEVWAALDYDNRKAYILQNPDYARSIQQAVDDMQASLALGVAMSRRGARHGLKPSPSVKIPKRAEVKGGKELEQERAQAERFREAGVDLPKPEDAGTGPGLLADQSRISQVEKAKQRWAQRRYGKEAAERTQTERLMDSTHSNRLSGAGTSRAPRESTRASLDDYAYSGGEMGRRLNPRPRPGSNRLRPRRGTDPARRDTAGRPLTRAEKAKQAAEDQNYDRTRARDERRRGQKQRKNWRRLSRQGRGIDLLGSDIRYRGLKRRPDGRLWPDATGEYYGDLDLRNPNFQRNYTAMKAKIEAGLADADERALFERVYRQLSRRSPVTKAPNSDSAAWVDITQPVTKKYQYAEPKANKPKAATNSAEPPKEGSSLTEPPKSGGRSRQPKPPKEPEIPKTPEELAKIRAANMAKYRQMEADGRIPKGSVARFEAGESWNQILADSVQPAKSGGKKGKAVDDAAPEAPVEAERPKVKKPSTKKGKDKETPAEEAPVETPAKAPKPKKSGGKNKPAEEAPVEAPAPATKPKKSGTKKPSAKAGGGKAGGGKAGSGKGGGKGAAATPAAAGAASPNRRSWKRKAKIAAGAVAAGGVAGWVGMSLVNRPATKGTPAPSTSAPKPDTGQTAFDPPADRIRTTKDGKKYVLDKKGRRISIEEYRRREKYRRSTARMGAVDRQRASESELQRRARYRRNLGRKTFGQGAARVTRNQGVPEGMPVATWKSMTPQQKRSYRVAARS